MFIYLYYRCTGDCDGQLIATVEFRTAVTHTSKGIKNPIAKIIWLTNV